MKSRNVLRLLVTIVSAAATWVSFGLLENSEETEERQLIRQRIFLITKLKELEAQSEFERCAQVRDRIFEIDSRLKEISENQE